MKLKKSNTVNLPSKNLKKPKKVQKDLSKVTTDEFFNQDFEADDSDEETLNGNDSDSEEELDPKAHQKSLKKLEKTDPEFFQFLKQNDKKLLNFDVSDQEDDSDDEDTVHVPNEDLEVASDEDDYEPEESSGKESKSSSGVIKVNLKLLKVWQEEIQKDKSSKTIKCIVEAFHAALLTVADPDGPTSVKYKVEGGAVFNGVVQLCILHLPNAFKRFLRMEGKVKIEAHKSKRFPKIRGTLKSYLGDLLRVRFKLDLSNVLNPELRFFKCIPLI